MRRQPENLMGKKHWQRQGAHAYIKQVERNTVSEKDLSQFSSSLRVTDTMSKRDKILPGTYFDVSV
jgi:hypothetical protein